MEGDWGRVATPPTIHRVSEPNSRKLLWRLVGKLAGRLEAPGGSGNCCGDCRFSTPQGLGSVFWQNGCFADFHFWAAGFFRGFYRRIVSPLFVGESAQKNPPGKFSKKSAQIYTTKIPNTFLERGWAIKARAISRSAKLPIGNCFRINYVKVTDTDTNRKLFRN